MAAITVSILQKTTLRLRDTQQLTPVHRQRDPAPHLFCFQTQAFSPTPWSPLQTTGGCVSFTMSKVCSTKKPGRAPAGQICATKSFVLAVHRALFSADFPSCREPRSSALCLSHCLWWMAAGPLDVCVLMGLSLPSCLQDLCPSPPCSQPRCFLQNWGRPGAAL